MRLRNKRTGEIFTVNNIVNDKGEKVFCLDSVPDGYELIGVPLITDEKTRKAVRAWAEANDIDKYQSEQRVVFDSVEHRLTWVATCIEFNERRNLENLNNGGAYTITELCGEEE